MSVEPGPPIRCVGDFYEDDVYSVGIAENADGSGWSLTFSEADEHELQDVLLGHDTYALSTAAGATTYGGVRRCSLAADALEVELSPEAALELSLPERFRLPLELDQQERDRLESGLARVGVSL
jgi:Immunity protein 10